MSRGSPPVDLGSGARRGSGYRPGHAGVAVAGTADGAARGALQGARRVVVKVGTGVVARRDGRTALGRLGALVEQVVALREGGREVLLVSSGAVGLGAQRLGLTAPTDVVDRQACAAAGQSALMGLYDTLFGKLGVPVAQVLLTEDDLHVRRRYLHLAATLERLLGLGVVPVINENDAVSTAEIALHGPRVFGDNDRLSALVASSLEADLLLLLTDVDAVYTAPPGEPGAARIPIYEGDAVRLGAGSALGRGGMGAKIAAAKVGQAAGVHVVVASASAPDIVARVVAGEDVGTLFPAASGLSGRRRWLAFATAPAGRLHVNAGALDALVRRGASLLAVGVTEAHGAFVAGDVVEIVGPSGRAFARGRAAVGADAVRALIGQPGPGKPVVHRDHTVILDEEEA
jgi:glutamate 5-kinase